MFKVPEHPTTPISSKTKDIATDDTSNTDEKTEPVALNNNIRDVASKTGTALTPIPYTEPSWGGLPDVLYSLEELKQGVSLRSILLDRSFHCFGRFNNCHVVMAHPSISRYHAVLQFRSTFSPTDERKGFYIIDLGSTHGTFVNKERIHPKTYVKVQVGHIIKFGSSTRMFLLHGPEDDRENESEYSYNQLREMKQKQLEAREKAYLEDAAKLCKTEDSGIDWGMGEDADEEADLSENPFAATNNEELYIEDPKKTLRGWFEREGEELSYNVEEKGFGHFRCTIELPIESNDGLPVIAEATVSGKKKEAVLHCALEACRILDRNGLLRQSVHESKQKKCKNWEENDFYDSDEDSFFDRTGELERKRKLRMIRTGKEQAVVDTHDTLVAKRANILQQIKETEEKLKHITKNDDDNAEGDDYMECNFKERVDKLEHKTLEVMLTKLQQDLVELDKLVNFTKPYNLPEIKLATSEQENDDDASRSPVEITETAVETIKEDKFAASVGESKAEKEYKGPDDVFKIPSTNLKSKNSNDRTVNGTPAPTKITGSGSQMLFAKATDVQEQITDNQSKKITIGLKRLQSETPAKKTKLEPTDNSEHYSNLIWKPPANQTGDGRTSLNDKLGY